MMLKILINIFLITTYINCDWVEIPQRGKDEQYTKKSDYTLFILTTTSSTTETPLVKHTQTNFNKNSNTTTEAPILTTENVKTNILQHTTLKSTNKKNYARGHVYRIEKPKQNSKVPTVTNINVEKHPLIDEIEKPNQKADGPPIRNTDFQRRSSLDEFQESTEDVFIDDNESGYGYSSFIPFLSKVQSALMKNAHKNKKSKMNVLSGLRDHLLYEIQSRIAKLWEPKSFNRGARDYKEDSHMDFPSNESALITIGFLTFAVFLIKLVMQLINAVSTNTTTTTMVVGRKRRDAVNEDAIKILNHIEQYTLK